MDEYSSYNAIHESLPKKEIVGLSYSLYTTEEIDRLAVVTVRNNSLEQTHETVLDPHFGPKESGEKCEYCQKGPETCEGHFGRIIIPPMYHPLLKREIARILTLLNPNTGELLIKKSSLKEVDLDSYSPSERLSILEKLSKDCDRMSEKGSSKYYPYYHKAQDGDTGEKEGYLYVTITSGKGQKAPDLPPDEEVSRLRGETITQKYESSVRYPFSAMDAQKILKKVSDEDAKILGFMNGMHPKYLIIERLLVIPYACRPSMIMDETGEMNDDFTSMYREIVSNVNKYEQAKQKNNEVAEINAYHDIVKRVTRIMANDDAGWRQGKLHVYKSIKDRMSGKQGYPRMSQGKRINYTGRSVASTGLFAVDEVGIPVEMCEELGRSFLVTKRNLAYFQAEFDAGRISRIMTKNRPPAQKLKIPVNKNFHSMFPGFKLDEGDIVDRMLQDGDYVLISRQPVLHRGSIICSRVVRVPEKTIQVNLSCTPPLNADFDGDEINVHVIQDPRGYIEAQELMGVKACLMSEKSDRPIVTLVQDALAGAYLLSRDNDEIPQALVDEAISRIEGRVKRAQRASIFSSLKHTKSFLQRAEKHGLYNSDDGIITGKVFISLSFPEDFFYDKKGIKIRDGVLLSGVLNKKNINGGGGIIAEIVKQYDEQRAVDFMSDSQFITNLYMEIYGLSISATDALIVTPEIREKILQIRNELEKTIRKIYESPLRDDQKENQIENEITNSETRMQNLIKSQLSNDNPLVILMESGAKGNPFNMVQLGGYMGQQRVGGRRILPKMDGGRILPMFEPGDNSLEARGFTLNSFSSGLSPWEYFNHTIGSREGLINTSTSTADTGDNQKTLVRTHEGISIAKDGSVRTSDDRIIMPIYGDDGLALPKLTNVGGSSKFLDIEHLAKKISEEYS